MKNVYFTQAQAEDNEERARVAERAKWLLNNGHVATWGEAIRVSERHETESRHTAQDPQAYARWRDGFATPEEERLTPLDHDRESFHRETLERRHDE